MFDGEQHPDLLVGLGVPDDAAVFRINAQTAVVSTVDFFAPVVDDPREFGQIAAANAISDVYAMGAEVVLALNIAAFPQDLDHEVVTAILLGGAEKVAEAGGVVAGGHTVWDEEPKYGLSVLGIVHPKRILRKDGLRSSDVLYLTKPLGTGTILSAAKHGEAEDIWVRQATDCMKVLNRHVSHIAQKHRLRAATDITGFGLMGHLWEMVERSGVTATVNADAMPLLRGARECMASGVHTGGEGRNWEFLDRHVTVAESVHPDVAALAFDPQTSGGLLLACSPRKAKALEASFAADGLSLWRLGRVGAGDPHIELA